LLKQKRDEQGLTAVEKDRLIVLQEERLDFLKEQCLLKKHMKVDGYVLEPTDLDSEVTLFDEFSLN
jgi:hypothetical protein